ncbi:hypothetical protein [Halovenus marina]|uniref:hypothetical protein n=1 Tax=Halovenus marina TaxID=3396621 RepID=UPI003F5753C5
MSEPDIVCSILGYLISKHRYGSPVDKETTVNRAGIRVDQQGEAKDLFDELRDARFILDCGMRGIQLNNSKFNILADYLYHQCSWDADKIEIRLKHYEGWERHDWVPSEDYDPDI